MMPAVEAYLALRRAAGFRLFNAEYLLASFAGFAGERNETHVRTETAIEWAAQGPSAAQRDRRLKTIGSSPVTFTSKMIGTNCRRQITSDTRKTPPRSVHLLSRRD